MILYWLASFLMLLEPVHSKTDSEIFGKKHDPLLIHQENIG
jgi:hypothetical protein